MMKNLIFIVFSIALLTQSCSQSDDFIDKQSVFEEEIVEEEIDFPKQVEAYGKAVAKEIEITVAKLNDLNMDYSEVVDFKDFRKKFYEDWYNASPTMARSRATGKIQSIEMMSATEFMERYNSLTDIQLEFIHKIIGECEKSRSSQDLLARLVALNKEIHAQVPEIEQERLLNVIAVLYYGGQKIVYLEHQGLMLRTPYNNIKLSKVKTRGPEDGGNIGEWCRKITATVWTIAIGEPTPFGEIVASVATVFTAAGFIYEVILCKENEGNSDMDFCMEKYVGCTGTSYGDPNTGGWGYTMCQRCCDYCVAQGVCSCPRPI